MAEIIGREIEVGLSTEATRGTAESTVDKWVKNVSATVVERAEHAEDDSTRGRFEDMDGRRVTQKYVEGDIEGIAHVDALGYLYSSVYGIVNSSVVSGSVYDHVFTLGQNSQHQSLTIFGKDGGVQQLAYAGCMVSTLEINATVDDYVRFTASFTGKTATDNSSTPSYDTEYDFIGRDITVKIADTEAGLTGATATKLKDITVTHDQGAIRDHVFGSYDPDDVYNSKQMIEGSFTINFTNEDFKDLYLGDGAKYMSITIQGEADLGGGNNPTITYLFNKVQFTDWNRSGGNDELVTSPVSFRAFYNDVDDQASQVTLRNLTSVYQNVPSS
jgi:hypothetical protein